MSGPDDGGRVRRVEHTMGTVFSFDVRGGEPHRVGAALDAAAQWLSRVDEVFSTYRRDSEISLLAAGTLALAECSPQVREVERLCEEARRRTGGWFSAHYAGGFDPTGLVKGWAVERAADGAAAGAEGCASTAAVTSRCTRRPLADRRDRPAAPRRTRDRRARRREELAVATSGPAERGCHIVDPRTGRPPATALASLTVVCRGLTELRILGGRGFGEDVDVDGRVVVGVLALALAWCLEIARFTTRGLDRVRRPGRRSARTARPIPAGQVDGAGDDPPRG